MSEIIASVESFLNINRKQYKLAYFEIFQIWVKES